MIVSESACRKTKCELSSIGSILVEVSKNELKHAADMKQTLLSSETSSLHQSVKSVSNYQTSSRRVISTNLK